MIKKYILLNLINKIVWKLRLNWYKNSEQIGKQRRLSIRHVRFSLAPSIKENEKRKRDKNYWKLLSWASESAFECTQQEVIATLPTEKLFMDGPGSKMDESNIKITVKFTTQSIPITISHDSTVQGLKTLLLPLTSILPRGQTLIFKGSISTFRYNINTHVSKFKHDFLVMTFLSCWKAEFWRMISLWENLESSMEPGSCLWAVRVCTKG